MMMRFRSLERPFMPDASLAPLVQLLQEALRLVEVLASVRVLRVDFQHRLPLGNGLGQLLLAIVADARIVVLVDEARPRLAQERPRVLVVRGELGELIEGGIGVAILTLVELLLAQAVQHLLLEGEGVGIARRGSEELVQIAQRLVVIVAIGGLARLRDERIHLGGFLSRRRHHGGGRRRGGCAGRRGSSRTRSGRTGPGRLRVTPGTSGIFSTMPAVSRALGWSLFVSAMISPRARLP